VECGLLYEEGNAFECCLVGVVWKIAVCPLLFCQTV